MKAMHVVGKLILDAYSDLTTMDVLAKEFNLITGGTADAKDIEAIIAYARKDKNIRALVHELKRRGLTAKAIGTILGVLPVTVYYHLRNPVERGFYTARFEHIVPKALHDEWWQDRNPVSYGITYTPF
jgi:hypothetical protein